VRIGFADGNKRPLYDFSDGFQAGENGVHDSCPAIRSCVVKVDACVEASALCACATEPFKTRGKKPLFRSFTHPTAPRPCSTDDTPKEPALVIDEVKRVLGSTLQLGKRAGDMSAATPLLGAIPELDSMAVVSLITALEDQFGISVGDDEIDAGTFETIGTLSAFVEQKLAS
jgi:acyl carrier protein